MKRREFLKKATTTAAAAAATMAVAGAVREVTSKVPAHKPIVDGSDVVVRPGSPLVLEGSVQLNDVELRGGQIVTHRGGVFHIARLRKV